MTVREDALVLFGFKTREEKDFFKLLLSVSGLGPRHGLSLLTEHGPNGLCQLILSKDTKGIASAHGVGKKLAERMVLDLSAKVEKLEWSSPMSSTTASSKAGPVDPRGQLFGDLSSALANLGFAPNDIRGTLQRMFDAQSVENLGFETCIRTALKDLSSHGLTQAEGGTRG